MEPTPCFIMLSTEAYLGLERFTTYGSMAKTALRLPDGRWQVPVTADIIARLDRLRLPGESDDDIVLRVMRYQLGQKPH